MDSEPSFANRLAALATAVSDAVTAETGDLSESAVAALIAIRIREPLAIQHIATTVGLTHSATVRLIDRLEKDWLVRRQRRKGREVLVETTSRGKRRVRDIHAKRGEAIGALIGDISDKDQKALSRGIDEMLENAIANGASPERLCRFCDGDATAALAEMAAKRGNGAKE